MNWKDYRNRILTTVNPEAFFTGDLKERGITYSRHGNELKCQCPFPERHLAGQDRDPSFTANVETGVYFCNACGARGNVHTYLCQTQKLSSVDAWYMLGDALGFDRPADADTRPMIDPALPGIYHQKLMQSTGVIRDVLREKRGLTDETLDRFMIGYDGERITIPVYDEQNELVNIRRYKWNSYEDSLKMINYEDALGNAYGENRIYGIEHLLNPKCKAVLWCEGEWDRLVAEQNNIPACTTTAGANNFRTEWLKYIKTKQRIYICYDNDEAGRLATEFLVNNLRGALEIYVVEWPKDWREKGDITDIFVFLVFTSIDIRTSHSAFHNIF